MKARQIQLPGFNLKTAKPFGGRGAKGLRPGGLSGHGRASHPNAARPFHSKMAMHVVLKSSCAQGEASLLFHAKAIEKTLANQSKIFGVKLYESANAGNHLHLVIRARSRRALRGYLRAVSGIIARKVSGIERGAGRMKKNRTGGVEVSAHKALNHETSNKAQPKPRSPGFWDARPFSRLVTWGRDYARLKNYLQINRDEMTGIDRLSVRTMLARIAEIQRSTGLISIGFGTG